MLRPHARGLVIAALLLALDACSGPGASAAAATPTPAPAAALVDRTRQLQERLERLQRRHAQQVRDAQQAEGLPQQ